ncbi:hypothetical protein AX17_004367 [Amanita inopinata Kibby_2008]|nr:hypothetical protein AX17_004367 [Amanita inopinata Kibby_2008]
MDDTMSVTFLGTSSGGGPTRSRNCSSLVCDLLSDGSLWMVDCAEGTIRQFHWQPNGSPHLRANQVMKLFITHMHADHIMGIVTFLRNVLYPPPMAPLGQTESRPPRTVEIYGPAGIRSFVRQNLKMTCTRMADHYVVHELLTARDPVTPCNDVAPVQADDPTSSIHCDLRHDWDVRHPNEKCGRDVYPGEDNFWREITSGEGRFGDVIVDAGPIHHRDPCIGYVFREDGTPQRKIVILGDTSDPSTIIPLCTNPSPSLLVHEATDASVPLHVDVKLGMRDEEEVKSKTLNRGHSLPAMAGAFAHSVDAKQLVLNHIGARFPSHSNDRYCKSARILSEIEKQASQAWGGRRQAKIAYDYMRVVIPPSQDQAENDGQQTSGMAGSRRYSYKGHRKWTSGTKFYQATGQGSVAVASESTLSEVIMVEKAISTKHETISQPEHDDNDAYAEGSRTDHRRYTKRQRPG